MRNRYTVPGIPLLGSNAEADDPLVWYEGTSVASSNARHLHGDPRGSIVLVAGSAGQTLAINTYDEYGIPDSASGNDIATKGRFRYTGQAWLPELDMYHYKARVYSPTLGRFLQTDPIGYEDQFNLYAYVGNDPVNGVDPTGTKISCSTSEGVTTCADSVSGGEFTAEGVPKTEIERLEGLIEPSDIETAVSNGIDSARASGASFASAGSEVDADQRYISTTGGWVDLRHVVTSALIPGGGDGAAEALGVGIELVQGAARLIDAGLKSLGIKTPGSITGLGNSAMKGEDFLSNRIGEIASSARDMNTYHGGDSGSIAGNVSRILNRSTTFRAQTGRQALLSRGFKRVR